jgi:hypothetical protein
MLDYKRKIYLLEIQSKPNLNLNIVVKQAKFEIGEACPSL